MFSCWCPDHSCPPSSLVSPKSGVRFRGESRYVEGCWGFPYSKIVIGFLVSGVLVFYCWFLGCWFLGFLVFGFVVSRFLGFKVSRFEVSWLIGFTVPKFQRSKNPLMFLKDIGAVNIIFPNVHSKTFWKILILYSRFARIY